MFPEDRDDRLRFRLNDENGVLCFTEFEILNPQRCRDLAEPLRQYLVGRPLADVDPDDLRNHMHAGDGECIEAIIRELLKQQRLFIQSVRVDQGYAERHSQ
jgi:hypothetical protein